MAVVFEWDRRKELLNQRKHGVTFEEASTVFGDSLAATFQDPDHSRNETRFITIGVSAQKKTLVVAHTEHDDSIRVISARRATRHEREFYEEK